jgi:hypothetical protein
MTTNEKPGNNQNNTRTSDHEKIKDAPGQKGGTQSDSNRDSSTAKDDEKSKHGKL